MSIISVMFQTVAYDIQFGFYRARDSESTFQVDNEGEEIEAISHPVDKMEVIFPMQVIDCQDNMIKVTFIAKEEGFYKILFSNEHSWMRPKTLKFKYVVLRPVTHQNDYEEPVEEVKKMEKENIGYIFNDPSKKLDFKMMDKTMTNKDTSIVEENSNSLKEKEIVVATVQEENTGRELKVDAPKSALTLFASGREAETKSEQSLILIQQNKVVINGQSHQGFGDVTSFLRYDILDKIKVNCDVLIVVPKQLQDYLASQISQIVEDWI